MKRNIGSTEKIIRLVLAVALFSLFFVLDGNARYWALTGFIPLVTGAINYCPIWHMAGINTHTVKTEKVKL